jgi:hypothetical protein
LLAAVVGKADPSGADRLHPRDRGKALASSSTLNRLELTPADANAEARYKKIVAHPAGMDACWSMATSTRTRRRRARSGCQRRPLHGHQEGRFFHGYDGHDGYLPLYIFSGEHRLRAR